LDRLAVVNRTHGHTSVLILDGLIPSPDTVADLQVLLRAIARTKICSIALVGTRQLDTQLAELGITLAEYPLVQTLTIPPLECQQSVEYLRSWIETCSRPNSLPVLVVPDALILAAHFSEGNLSQLNRLASNMLLIAACQNRKIVSSWDAWVGATHEKTLTRHQDLNDTLFTPPADWPHHEAMHIIEEGRRKVGLPRRRHRKTLLSTSSNDK
jgi:hypothetical protein